MILAVYGGHGSFHPVAVLYFSKSVLGRGLKLTKATVGGSLLDFFFQWLGVTRESEPPVPCGHRLSFVLFKNVSTYE